MKKIIYNILIFLILTTFAQTVVAQPRVERLKNLRRAYITDKLKLTPEESAALFPLLDEFLEKKRLIERSTLEQRMSKESNELTDEEMEEMLEGALEREEKILALRREYLPKFRKVLPPNKLARLERVQKEFKHELARRMRERAAKKKI